MTSHLPTAILCAAPRIVKRGPLWYAGDHEHTTHTHPESRGRRIGTPWRARTRPPSQCGTAPGVSPTRRTRTLGPTSSCTTRPGAGLGSAPRHTHHRQRLLADWRGLLAERAEERGLLAGLATDRHGRRAHLQLLGHDMHTRLPVLLDRRELHDLPVVSEQDAGQRIEHRALQLIQIRPAPGHRPQPLLARRAQGVPGGCL